MPRAFFQDGAFFQEGEFFETRAPVTPTAPAIITLGTPGAPVHALPFRALGGSVVDFDLLYGVLGHEATLEDIRPFFVLGTRTGLLRYFGYEIPREAIQAAVIESYATLLDIEDIVIESAPSSSNLFGYMGLTTRPMSTVRIYDDGYWSQLVVQELVLNSPSGIFVDIAQRVVMPVVTGTVSGYAFEDSSIVLTYGFQARRNLISRVYD